MTSYNVIYETRSPSGGKLVLCYSTEAESTEHALENYWKWRGDDHWPTKILNVEPAVTAAPESREAMALRAVLAMHNADGRRTLAKDFPQDYCTGCGLSAPCPTVSTIREALPNSDRPRLIRGLVIDWTTGRVTLDGRPFPFHIAKEGPTVDPENLVSRGRPLQRVHFPLLVEGLTEIGKKP